MESTSNVRNAPLQVWYFLFQSGSGCGLFFKKGAATRYNALEKTLRVCSVIHNACALIIAEQSAGVKGSKLESWHAIDCFSAEIKIYEAIGKG